MCSDVVMEAKDLRKVYHLYPNPMSRLKQLVAGDRRRYYEEFVALKGFTFELKKGEVLGVVGRNGAGKSTLLQLICGTLTATSGELRVNGRIAALLELGAGFNPDFSGRENVFLSGAVMGLSRRDIETLLDEIIDFAGIRPFIDQPVKTYSSGMYVRLAFAVATSVDPDILVIDEALSVGDGDFARRSFDRIMSMRDAGKTILFCSHALYQLETLCSRAIWLEAGAVVETGSPETVVANYQSFLDRMSINSCGVAELPDKSAAAVSTNIRSSVTRIQSTVVSVDGVVGNTLSVTSGQSSIRVDVDFVSHLKAEIPGVAVVIHSAGGLLVSSSGSWNDGVYASLDEQGCGQLTVMFEQIPLLKGRYTVGVLLLCERGIFLHDEADPVATLEVRQSGVARGVVNLPHHWSQPEQKKHCHSDKLSGDVTRWLSADAQEVDEKTLLHLFSVSFGHDISPLIWRWKYRFTPNPGTVVYDGERVVAFNGGMPRKARVFGQDAMVVQMGDVMVAPDVRGLLTRRGPFHLAVHKYFSERVGLNKEFAFAFGFPHARAARVGIKQKLYCEADKVLQARWCSLHGRSWKLAARPLTKDDMSVVDQLWAQMLLATDDVTICSRESSWIQHRYLDKPENSYQVMLVLQRFSRKPLGVIVLKDHGNDGVELLDIIAPRSFFTSVIHVARLITGRLGREWLFGWFTPSALHWCEGTDPVIEETEVVIPGSAVNDIEHALSVKDRWWLMGGDTDFR